jgi:hypothetical protein
MKMHRVIQEMSVLVAVLVAVGCNRGPTAEGVCRSLEQEKIAEACVEGPTPTFDVPRYTSQWTFKMAELSETTDPVLGKLPKPSGGVIQFESLEDRDVAARRLAGANSVLPVLPFVHKLEKPPMLVVMPKHEGALRSSGVLERLYGYNK